MILSHLSVKFFRNIQETQLDFSPRANLILGGNGHGKTNLLEAIYVLAITRSFRTHQSRDLVHWDSEQFCLAGKVQSRGHNYWLAIEHSPEARKMLVNNSQADLFEYLGLLNVVAFSTTQVEQFRSAPEIRRRLIDRGLYPLHPAHLKRVLNYTRLIKQKNSLLREGPSGYNKVRRDLLDSWNIQIADLGARIIKSRQNYIDKIADKLNIQRNCFTSDKLTIRYVSSHEIETSASLTDIHQQLLRKLSENRQGEFRARRATVGPHRDQIVLEVDGKSMQRFGSAGQQRSSLIAYQLAQMEVHLDLRGEYPLFLIDDVDAELDEERLNLILNILESKTQVFITTNKPGFIRERRFGQNQFKKFQVKQGHVSEVAPIQ